MKHKLILLSFLLISFKGISQNSFGVFGGMNNSSLSDGFLENVLIGKSFGFHIGGLYQYEFNETITFRPKLVLSLQGDSEETANTNFLHTGLIDYELTYINVPLNVKFFSRPYIVAGPQVGFLMGTKKGDRDYGDVDKKVDFGLNLGFGYDFNNFFVEANMYQGLTELMTIEDTQFDRSISPTNTVFQLSFGYYLQ